MTYIAEPILNIVTIVSVGGPPHVADRAGVSEGLTPLFERSRHRDAGRIWRVQNALARLSRRRRSRTSPSQRRSRMSLAASITTMTFKGVDTTGTSGSAAIGATGSGQCAVGRADGDLTTTRANSVVAGVGTDWDNAVVRTVASGQTMVHQYLPAVGDTYWVQRTTSPVPASGTTVTINDSAPTADRFNLTICEIRSGG
jgi:hypothetical protein